MKKTTDHFKISVKKLQECDGYGYTMEEKILLDASENTRFYNSIQELEECKSYYKSRHFQIVDILEMSDGRFALLLNY